MAITALPYVYCVQSDVEAVLSVMGLSLSLDDDQTGTPTPTQLAYLNNQIIPWESSRMNMYLLRRYDVGDLINSWTCNQIAAIRVARFTRMRRANPCPEALQEAYDEMKELLEAVQQNRIGLEDIPERVSGAIGWDNISHQRYTLRRNRVQTAISEQTPPQRPKPTDLRAALVGPETYFLG